jgi:hypothetical protein
MQRQAVTQANTGNDPKTNTPGSFGIFELIFFKQTW